MAKTSWQLDTAHSSIDFSIKHMMFATVRGSFHQFSGRIVADPEDLTTAEIEFTVEVASIDTRNADRDAHLKGADFFDVEHYPQIKFQATRITRAGSVQYDVTGDLTIRGITRPVTFRANFDGQGKDPWGNLRAGFSAEGSINRKDFGLTWNAPLETGGVLVGEDVKISIQIEATQAV
ncbi:MAG: YceI family protein [Alicyclobacillus sp.]|nr:YceI family protein [Alicyclobacillus sp.]